MIRFKLKTIEFILTSLITQIALVTVVPAAFRFGLGQAVATRSAEKLINPAVAAKVALTGKYFMAFSACNTANSGCPGPAADSTYLAQSNDGIAWTPVSGFTPFSGSVPDAIRRGNTLYIYNPSNIALSGAGTLTRFHLDTGVQDATIPVSLTYSNGANTSGFVDPSLILNPSRQIVLFYLPNILGQDPAQCPTGQTSCTKVFLSATEVSGSDGSSFVVDADTRASAAITSPSIAADPAVFQGPNGFILYVAKDQSVLAFTSALLQGTYTPIPTLASGVLVPNGVGASPSGYYDLAANQFITFVSQTGVIARAATADLNSAIPASSFTTVISGCKFPGLGCQYTVANGDFHLNTP